MKIDINKYKPMIPVIIAIAVFTLIIFGGAYAFFAANVNVNANVTNINTTLPLSNTTLTTTSTACSISPTAASMLSSTANNNTAVANNTCSLNITITGLTGVSQDYCVKLEATTPYTPTSGVTKEFTGQLTIPSGATAINNSTTEKQINTLVGKVASGTITVGASNAPTTHTYTFVEKWYNIEGIDQGEHAAKTYAYKLVASTECQ